MDPSLRGRLVEDLESLRAKAEEIARRAESDHAFRDRVLADPDTVLAEEGIRDDLAAVHAITVAFCWGSCQVTSCADGTCYYTVCPETCVDGVTLYRPPVEVEA